ncbi:deoxyribonuclease [bacterium]|nr:deoxyribonuclease [bacterium]
MVKFLKRKRRSSKSSKASSDHGGGANATSGQQAGGNSSTGDVAQQQNAASRPSKAHIPITRFIGPIISVAGIVFVLGMVVTGRVDLAAIHIGSGTTTATASTSAASVPSSIQPVSLPAPTSKSTETMSLATFSIQNFDAVKGQDPGILSVLASVISRVDIVAIQGVSKDATAIGSLMQKLNASGGQFGSQVSPPVGREGDMQCFAFIWDEARIQLTAGSVFVVQDPTDRMHFEPMVASFETRFGATGGRSPFRFTLINAHANPSDVSVNSPKNEMNVLDDVFQSVRQYGYQKTGEEDCILLGNLGVNTAGLGELGKIPNVVSAGGDCLTDTLQTQTLDHILIDQTMTREYTGRFGLVDLQRQFGITQQQALMVSDHLMLWAEFSVYEVPAYNGVASGGRNVRRY